MPLLSCILTSFKTPEEMGTSPTALPENILNFENYKVAINDGNLLLAFGITLIIVLCSIVLSTLVGTMLAYALGRLKFRGKKIILLLFVLAAFIPTITLQTSVYKMMVSFELVNTVLGYVILLSGTDIFAIAIFMNYFEKTSQMYDDSAILDGCSKWKIFTRIHLPRMKPVLLTMAILKGINIYNEYYLANLYLQDKINYPTITTSLYSFIGPFGSQYNVICSGIILTLIPIFVTYLILQKQIYNSISGNFKIKKEKK